MEVRARAAQLPNSDGVISIEAFQPFFEFVLDHHILLGEIPDVLRTVCLGLAQGGCFVQVDTALFSRRTKARCSSLPLTCSKKSPTASFEEAPKASVSPSVMEPATAQVRCGAKWSRSGLTGRAADSGVLTVTDQRIVYHGGRKTLDSFRQLATLNVYADAIDLGVTNRQSTPSFADSDPELVAGMIHAAVDHADGEVTIIRFADDPNVSPT